MSIIINKQKFNINQNPTHEIKIEPLIINYLNEYKEFRRLKTWQTERDKLNVWRRYLTDKKLYTFPLPESLAIDFLTWRKNFRTFAPRTLNRDLLAMRRFFKYCIRKKIILENPFEHLTLYSVIEKPIRILSIQEINIIEKYLYENNFSLYQIFITLVRTGLRSGELCKLKKEDIIDNMIYIQPANSKNKKERWIPILPKVKMILINLMDGKASTALLFQTKNKTPQTQSNIIRRFRTVLNKLENMGLLRNTKTINIHTLRKTFISHALMHDVPLVKVMSMAGHHDYRTTERYLYLNHKSLLTLGNFLPF